MKIDKFIVIIILALTLNTLFSQSNSEVSNIPNNYIVLLDLSDRIENQTQIRRDKEIFNHILNAFEKRQQFKYMYLTSSDRIQFTWANQESQNNPVFNELKNNLYLDMAGGRLNGRTTRPEFTNLKSSLIENFNQLYTELSSLPKTGSDIWSWFNTDLSILLRDGYNNHVIVISDGYLQFNSRLADKRQSKTYMETNDLELLRNKLNWLETFSDNSMNLIPPNIVIDDVNLLLLEFDPKNELRVTNEFAILKHYWETWLIDSGLAFKGIYKNDVSRTNINSIIDSFIPYQ
jgi:hypothetical protein